MTGTVSYCAFDRGFISHDGGGSDFFFWNNGNNIKWGDKVDFQFDPDAKVRFSYHRRRAFAVSVVRVSARQDVVAAGDGRNEVTQSRNVREAGSNNATRARAEGDMDAKLRSWQAVLDKNAKDSAKMKQALDAFARHTNRVGSS